MWNLAPHMFEVCMAGISTKAILYTTKQRLIVNFIKQPSGATFCKLSSDDQIINYIIALQMPEQ